MTYQGIFEKAKNILMEPDMDGTQEKLAFQFDIVGEGEGILCAEVKGGVLSVEPYEYYDKDTVSTCTTEVLFKIAEGKPDPMMVFIFRRLKVDGSIEKTLETKDMVRNAGG